MVFQPISRHNFNIIILPGRERLCIASYFSASFPCLRDPEWEWLPTLFTLLFQHNFNYYSPMECLWATKRSLHISYTRISSFHGKSGLLVFLRSAKVTTLPPNWDSGSSVKTAFYCSTDTQSGLYCVMTDAIPLLWELHHFVSVLLLLTRTSVWKYPFVPNPSSFQNSPAGWVTVCTGLFLYSLL